MTNANGELTAEQKVVTFDLLTEEYRRLKQTVAEAWVVAKEAPELNMCNYDHDDVRLLNDAMIEAFQLLDAVHQP